MVSHRQAHERVSPLPSDISTQKTNCQDLKISFRHERKQRTHLMCLFEFIISLSPLLFLEFERTPFSTRAASPARTVQSQPPVRISKFLNFHALEQGSGDRLKLLATHVKSTSEKPTRTFLLFVNKKMSARREGCPRSRYFAPDRDLYQRTRGVAINHPLDSIHLMNE